MWFHVVLFFYWRGREGQRELKRLSVKFEADASGRRFVTMTHDEVTKNHPGGVSNIPSDEKLARTYETSDENNGYKAMKLYISKLNPKSNAFSQYMKKQWNYDDEVWYDARLIGINKLDNTMKSISEAAKLLKMYTNCRVGATVITLWSNAGIQNCHIMAISGHCSEQSLAHYNTWPSTS